ncbi:MAG: hypothetical protein HQL78_07840 [Magnetococcales bacterium]|nr:hypothetical protein [Magnetococcales bacterium]
MVTKRRRDKLIEAIYQHYKKLAKGHVDLIWASSPKKMTKKEADAFFLGVMLDQGQEAERAWDGGLHLRENHFQPGKTFWKNILSAKEREVTKITKSGFDFITSNKNKLSYKGSYAVNYQTNKFPKWLRSSAKKIVAEYDSDPRLIWDVSPENCFLIYERFKEFDGIGDALAKMAQFILVRSYGVAGGKKNKHLLSIKPDIHLRRVLYRCGITSSEKTSVTTDEIGSLKLKSPADFDAACWYIGKEFCGKSDRKCATCPLSGDCEKNQ